MNSALIKILGDCLPPSCNHSISRSNSFAVSLNGQLAFICNDGKIKFCNIRNPDVDVVSDLEVHGLSYDDALSFTNMVFNTDGNTILLWGPNHVGVILMTEGMGTFASLINVTTVEDGPCFPIAKAAFHPMCNHCVVVLHQQDSLRLIDLRSNTNQVLALSSGRSFCSFTFGPAIDWLQFSIILLTNSGDLFTMCPVIPSGTVLSTTTVANLWAWADQLEYENDADNRMVEDYLSNVHSYLFNTFGARPLQGDDLGVESFVRAGESSHSAEFSTEAIEDDAVVRSLANYLPLLVGPLRMHRDAERGDGSNDDGEGVGSSEGKYGDAANFQNSRREGACDICTPAGARSFAASSVSYGAPVVVVSYSSGTVEVLVFDPDSFTSAEGRRRSGQSVHTTSYIGPSWRSIDRSRAGLVCSGAGVMLAETVKLPSPDQRQQSRSEEHRKAFWCVDADPVHHHLVHVSSPLLCEAHLLSLTWLEKLVEEDFRQQSSSQRTSLASSAESFGELVDWSVSATPATHPTKVLPVFVLPPCSSTEESSAVGQQVCLSGAVVLQDSMLGHVALFRTTTGIVSAVNLTVHTKLCELQESLHYNSGALELLPMKQELDRATSAEHMRWRRAQQCLQKVAEGLRAMPEMDAATAAALTPQASPHNKKVLLEAAQKLERDVVVPLNELSQTVVFSYEMVQESYRSQMEILEGSTNSNIAGGESLSQGLCKLVGNLGEERAQLAHRVNKIQEKFASQRDRAEKFLAFAVSQRAKMSRAENLYKRQLEDWSRVVSQMNEQVSALRVLSTSAGPAGSTASTPSRGSSLSQSPRANLSQPPLFSLSTTNNMRGEVASPSAARFLRSPAGGMYNNNHAVYSPSTTSGSVQSPTPSKGVAGAGGGGAIRAVFQSPQTPNAFRSFSGQGVTGGRQYSTPSTSTPTPTPGANSATAPQSRLYHTRHPPMATPSPNFYASYRASTLGSASTNAEHSSTAGATGASTVRTTRTMNTSQFGSPGPVGTGRAGGVASMKSTPPAITLSSEDQEACAQLLLSQTELLEKAQKELVALEEKLKSVREQNNFTN